MAGWSKWLWGGLGWAMFGPIGGIMGYALGSISENSQGFHSNYQGYSRGIPTQAGDFGAAMLILFAAVMKADNELKKTELEFVKKFFVQQFGSPGSCYNIKIQFLEISRQRNCLNFIRIIHRNKNSAIYWQRITSTRFGFGIGTSQVSIEANDFSRRFHLRR